MLGNCSSSLFPLTSSKLALVYVVTHVLCLSEWERETQTAHTESVQWFYDILYIYRICIEIWHFWSLNIDSGESSVSVCFCLQDTDTEVSVLLFDIYCTECISATQRDTVRPHPSNFLHVPIVPGKREHLNMTIIFTTQKKICFILICLLIFMVSKCLCVSLRLV